MKAQGVAGGGTIVEQLMPSTWKVNTPPQIDWGDMH